jgi:hypothetical protein
MNHEVLDPLLASIPTSRRNNDLQTANSLGGFPTNFLRQVVQMSKLLSLKQDRLKQLASLNTDAEKMVVIYYCYYSLLPLFVLACQMHTTLSRFSKTLRHCCD